MYKTMYNNVCIVRNRLKLTIYVKCKVYTNSYYTIYR